ncbi:MAG TPA: PadR family transcriptional regulator [Segeticoccus sp.]|nr:PadR family transcriptional regulator [Segeticoccus sp.]
MSRRSATLELAVLGLLHDVPMHGYELRKRLNAVLGVFRPLSYGTLYPCLRGLVQRGWIREVGSASRRGRIVYELTPAGTDQFRSLLTEAGPAAWEDETFDVHFAFFARTEQAVRLRILEGRRSRLEERLDHFRQAAQRGRARVDAWTAELQRHGLESTEREVRWLSELIESERGRSDRPHRPKHPQNPHNPDNHNPDNKE